MPLRQYGKAKAHVFLDVEMEDVVRPAATHELRAGWGTKVVVTLGPACREVPTLAQLLRAGVTCARVDLSWGTKQYHERSLANLAEAMRQTRLLCSVWLDTTGREVVVRRPVEYDASGWPGQGGGALEVHKDQIITITTDPTAEASPTLFPVNFPGFPDLLQPGQAVQIGRYLATGTEGTSLYADVVEVGEGEVTCVASNSAILDGLLSVMVCHADDEDFRGDLALPVLTEHDVDCLRALGSQFEVDFVALSFCNSAEDLYAARALLDALGMAQTKIVAKIERKAAVRNFEVIAHVADGIIVSRGNLGLDFEPEVMALLQKRIISRCNQLGKAVLITRIVDSMVASPRPTRAEATDVANAVLDGADGLLLGAETLRGGYPLETVATVLRLASAAEKHFDYQTHHEALMGEAYEEEVSLKRADVSVTDFGMLSAPDTAMHRSRARSFGGSLRDSASFEALGAAAAAAGLSGPAALRGIAADPAAGAKLAARGGKAPPAAPPPPANGVPADAVVADGPPAGQFGGAGVLPGSPAAPYISAFGSLPPQFAADSPQLRRILLTHAPYMSKLESIASSATRTAEKIHAGLIVVMVQSGRTVSLVAKYRPPMPIMAVVVPTLKSDSLSWQLEGKYLARQTLVLRGVVPMMAAPMSDAAGSDDLLGEAVHSAFLQRLVRPLDHVVCIMSQRGSTVVKVVQVNRAGTGLRVMGGLNSERLQGEAPDIVSERTPFGAFDVPPSPHLGPQGMSPGRTLSGRPSLMVPPAPLPVALGSAGAPFLMSTASEAQAYADFDASRLAAEFAAGRPGRAVRTAGGGSPLGGGVRNAGGSPPSGGAAFSISSGPFSGGGSPASSGGTGRDPASPQGRTGLDPITELPVGVGATGANGGGV